MLKCNLAVLLAERNLKITKVSNDTGISRTTLTSLANNYSQGIQFDTLDTLCSYLRVKPFQFFSFLPYNINVKAELSSDKANTFDIEFVVSSIRSNSYDIAYLVADVRLHKPELMSIGTKIKMIDIFVGLPDDERQSAMLIEYLKDLEPLFKQDIEEKICEDIYNHYFNEGYEEGFCNFSWSKELE